MDDRIKWLITEVVQDIVGLDVALFFQAHPNVFDTPPGIAMRLGRSASEIEDALERLYEHDILERYDLGGGKYKCYTLKRTPEVWSLLCKLAEVYLHNPRAQRQVIELLVLGRRRRREQSEGEGGQEG